MTPGYLLLWIVGLSTVSFAFRAFRSNPYRNRHWIVISGLIIAVTAWVAVSYDLSLSGYLGAVLWLALLILPNLLTHRIERLSSQGKFLQAGRLSHFVKFLHPTREYFQLPKIFRSLREMKRQPTLTTEQLLRTLAPIESTIGKVAITQRFTLEADWEGFLRWADASGGLKEFRNHSVLLTTYLRSLGETGQINELVLAFRAQRSQLESLGSWAMAIARLNLFAFGGSKTAVLGLFSDSLSSYPQIMQLFWLATADAALGNQTDSEKTFQMLVASDEPRIRRGAERRLTHPLALADQVLRADLRLPIYEEQSLLSSERIEQTTRQSRPKRKPYATYVLIALNCAMFLLERYAGDPTSNEVLIRLGALIPEAVAEGEWWRLVAATFLHAGELHLGMNMFALFLIGPFVEFTLGKIKYLIAYFFAGILSMLIVTELAWHNFLHDQLLVGASGAIMGLIGTTAAIFLKIWLRSRAPMASQRIRSLGMALLIQMAFDYATPQVSMTAHLAGAASGFLIGLIL